VVSVGFGIGFLTSTKISCRRLVITRMPAAKCKLRGWLGDGALLMGRGREKEQTIQTTVPAND